MDYNVKKLRTLLLLHAIITAAAGFILILYPSLIPSTVDIEIKAHQYLLCYFLAAAELAIAFLSFFGRKLKDKNSLKLISSTFILFHITTSVFELYALSQGLSAKIIGNIVLRILIAILFFYYGIYKIKTKEDY